jgi:hypothetical protein
MRAIALLLVGACGRIGFSESGAPTDAGPEPIRTAIRVEGLSPFPAGAVDLGVSQTPTGFTIVFAERAGSSMFGVNLDPSFQPDADWRLTEPSFTYVGTTLEHTGTALVTTMTRDVGQTFIKRYVPDLSSYVEFAGPNAMATRASFVKMGVLWYYVLADDQNVLVQEMDDGQTVGGQQTFPTPGALRSGTAAGGEANLWVVAERQLGTCTVTILATPNLVPTTTTIQDSCRDPRAASDGRKALVVAGDGTSLSLFKIDNAQASLLAPAGPGAEGRIALDVDGDVGTWIAYRDAGTLGLRRLAGDAPIDVPIAGMPLDTVTGYEFVRRADRTYLVAIAGRDLYFVPL